MLWNYSDAKLEWFSLRISSAVRSDLVLTARDAPWKSSSLMMSLYSKNHSTYSSPSPVSMPAHSLITAMCRGVLPSRSCRLGSAPKLNSSSTFFNSLKITAKCKGVAYSPDLMLASNLKLCLRSSLSFKTSKDKYPP